MKKNTSFRLEEEQISQLDKIVEYYKEQMQEATASTFKVQVSKATVLDMMIKDKYQQLVEQGLIQE